MGSKKTTETKSNQTTTVAPPSWTMPGIADASGRVINALNSLPGQQYQGDFVAQPNQGLINGAVNAYTGAAAQGQQNAAQLGQLAQGVGALPQITTGNYNVGSAYDINPAIQAATAPLFKQLTEGTLPGLRSAAIDSGAYSGDRAMSVLPSQAIQATAENAQNLAAQIGYQNYNDMEQRRLQGYTVDQGNALQAQQLNNAFRLQGASAQSDLLNEQMKMLTSGGDLYSAAAGTQQQAQQAGIDNALKQAQYSYMYPFQGLDIASSLLAQLSGNYGTTTSNGTQTQVQSTSGLGNVMQGVLGGASLLGSIPMGGGATLGGNLLSSLFKK